MSEFWQGFLIGWGIACSIAAGAVLGLKAAFDERMRK